MGGKGGIRVATTKKCDTVASLETKKIVSGVVWSNNSAIVASFATERAVQYFGIPPDGSEKASE